MIRKFFWWLGGVDCWLGFHDWDEWFRVDDISQLLDWVRECRLCCDSESVPRGGDPPELNR